MIGLFTRSNALKLGLICSQSNIFAHAQDKESESSSWNAMIDVMGKLGVPEKIPRGLEKPSGKLLDYYKLGIPQQIGYGFMMGYTSGFAVKKFSKVIAFMVGSFFIFMQTLQYYDFIEVKHEKVEKIMKDVLDVNKDGKIDEQDAIAAYNQMSVILGYNLPSGGGFASGLLLGLRS